MFFGRSYWRTIERGMEREWLVTNGIGGFASSTICGANSRRYHGLLIASLKPPVQRHLILSKIDESLFIDGETYFLYSHKTPGSIMDGFIYQELFNAFPVPEFCYRVRDIFIKKKVCMVQGENTTVITYEIYNSKKHVLFRAAPLVNFRNYHHCSRKENMAFFTETEDGVVRITPYCLPCKITLQCSEGVFTETRDNWFMNMEYPAERERGLDYLEDHYIPGYFDLVLEPGKTLRMVIKASVEDVPEKTDGFILMAEEEERRRELIKRIPFSDELGISMGLAADAFIVQRKSTNSKTIIAGYPWFTDWGRDTMIALPGLTLSTGRYDDAKEILHTFCRYIYKGLIPNLFPDEGQEPAYNSADASLWFFESAKKYLDRTGDLEFLEDELLPAMEAIISAYREGTLFNIHMDRDYLISAGGENTQLTWMDAIAGGDVATPRWGKAVEINALWYNALRVMAECLEKLGQSYMLGESEKTDRSPEYYLQLAAKVQKSFIECFFNKQTGCLYDSVMPSNGDVKGNANGDINKGVNRGVNRDVNRNVKRDDSMRPNQIIAVSLSYPVVTPEIAESIIDKVSKSLYTPFGLRSLSTESPMYKGVYMGDSVYRDRIYHQGTVWPWLLAPFIKAYLSVNKFSEDSIKKAENMLLPFKDHINDACIGYVSEIFDGDSPFYPRGCPAQAWSVAAILEILELIQKQPGKL